MEEQVKMITLCGKEPKKMNRTEIRRELRVQKALLRVVKRAREVARYKNERKAFDIEAAIKEKKDVQWKFDSWQIELPEYRKRMRNLNMGISNACTREEIISFYDVYIENLEAHIAELEHYKERRQEEPRPESAQMRYYRRKALQQSSAKRREDSTNAWHYNEQMDREGIGITWDKDRFMLIANDRGYMTEASMIYAIQTELGVDRGRAEAMFKRGKFTWGQVMCLGALMGMTPKEFCDTFLDDYFEAQYGEYRASYKSIDKTKLLTKQMNMLPRQTEEPKEIMTDASGKPIEDDEVWFDD